MTKKPKSVSAYVTMERKPSSLGKLLREHIAEDAEFVLLVATPAGDHMKLETMTSLPGSEIEAFIREFLRSHKGEVMSQH